MKKQSKIGSVAKKIKSFVGKKEKVPADEQEVKKEEIKPTTSRLHEGKALVEATPYVPTLIKPKWYQFSKKKEYNKEMERLNDKSRVVLVRMEMNNGRFREFTMLEELGSFVFEGGRYVLDIENKYYIIERDIWAYDFHESISLPIKKRLTLTDDLKQLFDMIEERSRQGLKPRIEANEIKKLIENSNLVDTESSINPTTLKRFVDSEVIKQVLQGAMLGKVFKVMLILIIIDAILDLIQTLIGLYTSGVFEKISQSLKGGK